ncbi:MAG: aminotransferase class I/II-fold pyridoxal phosphate-dependent enzyme [Ignavibacteriota bacterium]|nr:aminotransferase class I/II-fold pyridoxal phosphate-dependent enzyme [Ignavibacteriota bacterium]
MDNNNFDDASKEILEWVSEYLKSVEMYPVKSQVKYHEVYNQLPDSAPSTPEDFKNIFNDFQNIIMPGITHWQSPNFFAYFPANSSVPSILAEMLTSALGAQCMKWETSPSAAELEEKVMIWLRDMIGLPKNFIGVIQDTASTSTLASIITAREYHSDFKINKEGFSGNERYRVYCSTETHSSIEKAVKIAGIGRDNLVKVAVDENFAMIPAELEKAIESDINKGFKPLCVVAALGTTGTTAIDPLKEISALKKKYNFWLHVDAAYLGTALILPEYRWMIEGIDEADSFVFNPHKWMFTNFDCSAYFVKDKNVLLNTFEIIPEYLKTRSDNVANNYCDWGIPLGRRFRALKLWFVIRSFGVEGLKEKVRYHLKLAKDLYEKISSKNDFQILAPLNANVVCFRYKPGNIIDENMLNILNEDLMHKLNNSGKMFLTHTKLNGKFTLRIVIAQTNVEERNVNDAWELIKQYSDELKEIN